MSAELERLRSEIGEQPDVGGRSSQAAIELATAIRERGGQAALVRVGELEALPDHLQPAAALPLGVPVAEPFAPILAVVLGQLLAVELALALGIDPARPRGLHKVTVTR